MGGFLGKILKTVKKVAISNVIDLVPGGSIIKQVTGLLTDHAVVKDVNGNVITTGSVELSPEALQKVQLASMEHTFSVLEENHEHLESIMRLELKGYQAETDRNSQFEGDFKDLPEEAKIKRALLRPNIVEDVWLVGKVMFLLEALAQLAFILVLLYGTYKTSGQDMSAAIEAIKTFKFTKILPWDNYIWIFSGTVGVFFTSRTIEKNVSTWKQGHSKHV